MLFLRRTSRGRERQRAWLYSVVFAGRLSVLLVCLLFCSIMIQPINQAFAEAPEEAAAPEPVAEDVRPQEPEAEAPPVIETPAPETPPAEEPPAPEETPDTPPATDPVDVPPQPTDDTPPSPTATSTDTGSSTDSGSDNGGGDSVQEDEQLEDNEIVIAEQETKRVRNKNGEILKIESLVTEENYYQFNKQSCIEVGPGSFHCTTKHDNVTDTDSVVYAERDKDGDMEIFLKTSRGTIQQITDNTVDDLAPHYDAGAMKVVWHQIKDGRYQIMMYDILEEKETQLTFSKTNNMEPKVSNAGIVWQAWDDNDWEIMYFDGTYTEQITDNDVQDVAPVIQDKYILWNVLGGEEQQARVYSLETHETVTIQGHEGGSIVNPRFVLVYDTRYENGDVVTQTFDPSTGVSEPVAATPAQKPVDIPKTDPTGEIRALIQGKAQKDEKEFKDLSGPPPDGTGTSTISGPDTLTLNATSTDLLVHTPVIQTDNFELTEYDLVIPEHALEQALAAQASTTESTQ